jgi:D-alanine-D-alanine ligase
MAMKKKIAVIYGGDSSEWVISKKSAATVAKHLNKAKYEVYTVCIRNNEWWLEENGNRKAQINREDFSCAVNGSVLQFDYAFIEIHGTPGEDGKLQGYFDMIGMPYSTCNQLVSSITFNKSVCVSLLKQYGFRCAKSVLLKKGQAWNSSSVLKEITLPCFVKPNNGGSSFGISKVTQESQLEPAILKAFQEDTEIMVEEMMMGKEVTNGAFRHHGKVQVMPVTEIVSKNDFFDFQAKYEGASDEITPARLSDEITLAIQTTTNQIYEKLNLSGLIRIDYILQNDTPWVIEVNTTPGLSEESIIPQQAQVMGITLESLFDMVIQASFSTEERKVTN